MVGSSSKTERQTHTNAKDEAMREFMMFSQERDARRSENADKTPIRKAKPDKPVFLPKHSANPTKYYDKKRDGR